MNEHTPLGARPVQRLQDRHGSGGVWAVRLRQPPQQPRPVCAQRLPSLHQPQQGVCACVGEYVYVRARNIYDIHVQGLVDTLLLVVQLLPLLPVFTVARASPPPLPP